ncbi:ABC transporter substrate-binding protein [Haladaptatus halobius]|uniref:ABC transporter substrate-binding protein n=1 Tax=Haladaptatus halobius TaxID=2884875 RepID=UPI001D0A69D2|nr:ABC transporter substrate-binding protein [Haladaptatus halobius]
MTENNTLRNGITRRKALEGLGLIGATTLAGCSNIKPTASQGVGLADMRIATVLSPTTLDPFMLKGIPSEQVISQIFQGLYTYGDSTDLVPELADGEPQVSNNGRTYTVKLAKEAKFQNGQPVTAEDVKYSFEEPLRKQPDVSWDHPTFANRWKLNMIEAVKTPNERTIRFELSHLYPSFHHVLTQFIVPKSVREADPKAFAHDPVGSGPFEVDLFKPGKYALLTRWKDYWDTPKPQIDQVKFIPVFSGITRTMSLWTNQNHIAETVEPKFWQVTKGFSNTRVSAVDSFWYYYLGFNCNEGPTTDPRVRKAIDYCVDMDEMVKNMINPAGKRQYSPLPRRLAEQWKMPLEEWENIPRKKNIPRAKELFDEAGIERWAPKIAVPGTKSSGDELREKMAEAVVEGLGSATFLQAKVDKYPWPVFQEKILTGADYDMFIGDWVGFPDPDSFMYPLFHEDNEGETNGTFYQNEEVMNKLSEARKSDQHEKRKQLYESAITTVLEDRVHLPLYMLKNSFALRDSVSGFSPHPITTINPRLVGSKHSVSLE